MLVALEILTCKSGRVVKAYDSGSYGAFRMGSSPISYTFVRLAQSKAHIVRLAQWKST
jgi:hypothetical protein